jgi:arylsulfatase A-like enzyme
MMPQVVGSRTGFIGLLVVIGFLVGWLSSDAAAAERLPNVVLIFTDDQGYGDIGSFGAKGFSTPNLDRLAREGRRFTNFHVAQPVCSASRAGLLTGCYPNRIGIHGALGPNATHGIHDDETTLGEIFKSRGYSTAVFGKWHLGHHPQFLPTRHGFDEYLGLPYSNDMWPNHPTGGKNYPPLPLIDGNKVLEINPDQTQLTTRYTERAVKFIERGKDKPFFLYLPHSMPHVPLHVSDKFRGKSEQGLYGDVISEIDWSVGQILDTLDRLKLAENTLVIFTTDNGPWLSYGNHAGTAGPLREGKGTTFEGGVRVPCLMRWPEKIPAGTECREPLMTIDLLPTFAKLIDAESPKRPIDGKNVWPLIANEPGAKSPHEAYFMYYETNQLQAVLSGRWKLYLPHKFRTLAGKLGGSGGKPGPYEQRDIGTELYDLEADLGETKNVADQHADVVERLLALAEAARDDMGDSLTKRIGKNVREPGKLTVAASKPDSTAASVIKARQDALLLRDIANSTAATALNPPHQVVSLRKIWDAGKHNAFTDLVRWHDQWWCVFREGAGHVSTEADIRVITSADGDKWESAALIELSGHDLRDPKVTVTPDGKRLMIVAGDTIRDGTKPATWSRSFVTFSDDGRKWSRIHHVGEENSWLWRVTWHDGKAYGVTYDVSPESRSAKTYGTSLLVSNDGKSFKPLMPNLSPFSGSTEATLRFAADGTCFCIQRRDGKETKESNFALLGISQPPYTEWRWGGLGMYFGGPNFIQIPDGRWIAAGRLLNVGEPPTTRTVVCELEGGHLRPLLLLPSGGDSSYPGLAWHDDQLWMSYYSSHEGKTNIYMARIKIGR